MTVFVKHISTSPPDSSSQVKSQLGLSRAVGRRIGTPAALVALVSLVGGMGLGVLGGPVLSIGDVVVSVNEGVKGRLSTEVRLETGDGEDNVGRGRGRRGDGYERFSRGRTGRRGWRCGRRGRRERHGYYDCSRRALGDGGGSLSLGSGRSLVLVTGGALVYRSGSGRPLNRWFWFRGGLLPGRILLLAARLRGVNGRELHLELIFAFREREGLGASSPLARTWAEQESCGLTYTGTARGPISA